ncbi:hypothetical protein [Rufibacter psychrotolerans]|uniref:hypothetical protein n=1 Tax=Rufibacter psychrotolerans TaxID=2812556 RepID=UPI001967920A|nr:hypothetical protein [Rufibacter sp. SYSU D00308]
MNSKRQNRQKSNLPLLVVLAVLAVLSSCSVRKSMQASLELPVTRLLVPAKTILTGEQQCASPDTVALTEASKKTGFELPIAFLPFFSSLYPTASAKEEQPSVRIVEGPRGTGKVPIYILYKKMKLWA